MPCDYRDYPDEWPDIRKQILERAGHRCEQCGVNNYAVGYRDDSGHFRSTSEAQPKFSEAAKIALDQNQNRKSALPKIFVIVLTIAHMYDKNPQNCDPGNLKALCQRCHLRYDSDQHKHNAAVTRQRKSDERNGQTQLLRDTNNNMFTQRTYLDSAENKIVSSDRTKLTED